MFGRSRQPKRRVRLTPKTLAGFPRMQSLVDEGKARFDSKGRLRYAHGAPVGDMCLVRVNENGTPIYKESAEEWFDPESPAAKDFVWL